MTIEWATFIAELASNPVLVAVTLLNIGVIVVNGATDAPNAPSKSSLSGDNDTTNHNNSTSTQQ